MASSSADKSIRYVAEENIEPAGIPEAGAAVHEPPAGLMRMAGRWFKRWDPSIGRFVSNLREEYPDD